MSVLAALHVEWLAPMMGIAWGSRPLATEPHLLRNFTHLEIKTRKIKLICWEIIVTTLSKIAAWIKNAKKSERTKLDESIRPIIAR
jgi:hypothetical protein